MIKTAIAALAVVVSAGTAQTAYSAEIQFFCAGALQTTMRELIPQFERSSGHKVTISYAAVGALANRIQKGETADVAILSRAQVASLVKEGKVMDKTETPIAKVGIGVFVRKGAVKPDIASSDTLKKSMLGSKAIAFNDPATGGPVGIYLADLIGRLGIADEMKSRIILTASGIDGTAEALAKGDADIGFSQMIDIAPAVELVGPLPQPIQSYTIFAAGVLAASRQAEAGKALISFITSPEARAVFKAKGFDPS